MDTQTAPASAPPSTTQTKKPYIRELTAQRREQNRRSQKVHREKLKKRLAELEESALPAPVPVTVAVPTATTVTRTIAAANTNNSIDLNAAFEAAGDLVLPLPCDENGLPKVEVTIRPRNVAFIDPSPQPPVLSSMQPTPFAFLEPDSSSPDLRSFWPMPAYVYRQPYVPPPPTTKALVFNDGATTSPYLQARQTPHTDSNNGPIPSPYLNHLLLTGESCFSATLSIAFSLGISRSSYINDHPSPFPFSTAPLSSNIPNTLLPTTEQLTLPHPSYLDCIVFPRFRSNAIVLSSRGELDHFSLWLDLMHDGLACWGSRHGKGRSMAEGVAWSRRSWEGRPWFLKKWGFLVDGTGQGKDEDGIWEGSHWWAALRGEAEDWAGRTPGALMTCNVGLRNREDVVVWHGRNLPPE